MTNHKQRRELDALRSMSDDEIDFSDIPETLDWSKALRGAFHQPDQALLSRLTGDFIDQPQEDGMQHPSEQTLRDAFRQHPQNQVSQWISRFCDNAAEPTLGAGILRSIANLHRPGSPQWREDLVSKALTSPSSDVRDAAIQAIKKWQDPNLN